MRSSIVCSLSNFPERKLKYEGAYKEAIGIVTAAHQDVIKIAAAVRRILDLYNAFMPAP
jgi:hypothetical protein